MRGIETMRAVCLLVAFGMIAGCEEAPAEEGLTEPVVMTACTANPGGCTEVTYRVETGPEGGAVDAMGGVLVEVQDAGMEVVARHTTGTDGYAYFMLEPGAYLIGVRFGDCSRPDGNCFIKYFPQNVMANEPILEWIRIYYPDAVCPPREPRCGNIRLDRVIKPNVYLYPEETTEVAVTLDPMAPGKLTTTIPDYGNGWKVTATPDGILDDQWTYLFYEGDVVPLYQLDFGYSVSYEEREEWMREMLPLYGLNEREIADFVDYWTEHLPPFPYYLFFPQDNAVCDRIVPMTVDPAPDSVLRIWFYVVGAYGPFELPEPELPAPFVRDGFTVTEWGIMVNEFSFGLDGERF